MKLLFVCSGNSCRSPMAMAIAQWNFGKSVECDSAAGKLGQGEFKANKSVSRNAADAIIEVCGGPFLANYKPKALSKDLVKWADWVLFLGAQFKQNAIFKFPDFQSTMTMYGSYESKATGVEMVDIPDPFDGDHWEDYFGIKWPGKTQDAYNAVAKAMRDDFQRTLKSRLRL